MTIFFSGTLNLSKQQQKVGCEGVALYLLLTTSCLADPFLEMLAGILFFGCETGCGLLVLTRRRRTSCVRSKTDGEMNPGSQRKDTLDDGSGGRRGKSSSSGPALLALWDKQIVEGLRSHEKSAVRPKSQKKREFSPIGHNRSHKFLNRSCSGFSIPIEGITHPIDPQLSLARKQKGNAVTCPEMYTKTSPVPNRNLPRVSRSVVKDNRAH